VIVLYFADASPYVSAVAGLAGAVIGGSITGMVSLRVARDTRIAAEHAWVRDSRRGIYDRFLVAGQRLLAVMEAAASTSTAPDELRPAVDEAYSAYVGTYASVQTVAELPVVLAARTHTYRLQALKDILDGRGPYGRKDFDRIAQLVRDARHDTIDAMRADLDLHGSAKPPAGKDYAQAVVDAAREETPQSAVP
jgi:tetrahydromethanopterin S-methyltransferase subunit H